LPGEAGKPDPLQEVFCLSSIQQGAQVVKGATQVDAGDIYMPVFMGLQWLYKAVSFFAGFAVPAPK
jgi:hypothetical protein